MIGRRIPDRHLAPALLGALLLAVVGCGQGDATLTLTEFAFNSKTLRALAGQPVTLTVVSAGKIDHNWVLDAAVTGEPVAVVLAPGERKVVTFTPRASGTYTYACTIPGHAQAGMVGTLRVDERE